MSSSRTSIDDEPKRDEADYSSCSDVGDAFRDALVALTKLHSEAITKDAARMAVLGELVVAVLEHLPPPMRTRISRSFRERIDANLTTMTTTLPLIFRCAMRDEVDFYLSAIEQ